MPGLDEAALAAARQWVFKPALSNNQPVAVWVAIPMRFGSGGPRLSAPPQPAPERSSHRWGDPLDGMLAELRSGGIRPPGESDALLRERIIRHASREGIDEVPGELRDSLETASRLLDEPDSPADATRAMARLAWSLIEAPWWPAPYRLLARLQEARGDLTGACTSLDLYLVADPEAPDWVEVRAELRRMRDRLAGWALSRAVTRH
jgi:hypothetical protein